MLFLFNSLLANNQQGRNCFQLTVQTKEESWLTVWLLIFVKGKLQTSEYGSTSPKGVKLLPLTTLFHEKSVL